LILFSGEATLKSNIDNVTYFSKVGDWINQYKETIYTDDEVDFIYKTILENNLKDRNIKKEHIKNIRLKKDMEKGVNSR
jgi:hypothetical protein